MTHELGYLLAGVALGWILRAARGDRAEASGRHLLPVVLVGVLQAVAIVVVLRLELDFPRMLGAFGVVGVAAGLLLQRLRAEDQPEPDVQPPAEPERVSDPARDLHHEAPRRATERRVPRSGRPGATPRYFAAVVAWTSCRTSSLDNRRFWALA